MDDISSLVSQIMSDPEAVAQLKALGSSLGLDNQPPPAYQQTYAPGNYGAPYANTQRQQPAPDLSALAALLGGAGQSQQRQAAPDLSSLAALLGGAGQPQQQYQQQSTPDLSSLASLLGGLRGQQPSSQQQAPEGDISMLTALLNSGNRRGGSPATQSTGIDFGSVARLAQALSSFSANRANIDLLLALKPRLKEERARKVDDAIRLMQLVQFLPLIKETGLFGDMDRLLGGNSGGGRNNLLGNLNGMLGRR